MKKIIALSSVFLISIMLDANALPPPLQCPTTLDTTTVTKPANLVSNNVYAFTTPTGKWYACRQDTRPQTLKNPTQITIQGSITCLYRYGGGQYQIQQAWCGG